MNKRNETNELYNGFNLKNELLIYKNIGKNNTRNNNTVIFYDNYSDWKNHIEVIMSNIEDNENFRYYMKKSLREKRNSLQLLVSLVIPVEIAMFSLFININEKYNIFAMVVSVMIIVGFFTFVFGETSKEIDFLNDVNDILIK
jgi:hypothetical protein